VTTSPLPFDSSAADEAPPASEPSDSLVKDTETVH
jgi:hypothetical protein